jgi:lipopolysaccharide/colanic/teichoic acid biosynthesis glycosyltransferase
MERALKRSVDLLAASILLLASTPLLLASSVLIKLTSPGPVIHRRRVLGRHQREFQAYKLRTMVVDAEARLADNPELHAAFNQSYKLRHDPRVTRVGRWLRKFSIDELPQLANVLDGEMSLVGPRMITPEELSDYGDRAADVLRAKPGLTGPWQVAGRQDVPKWRRVEMDLEYIESASFLGDLVILIRTVPTVLSGRGAY